MDALWQWRLRLPTAEVIPSEERLQRFSPQKAPPHRSPNPPHQALLRLLSTEFRPSGALRTHWDDLSEPFCNRSEPYPEAQASRSRPIRSSIAANSWRGTVTPASLEHDSPSRASPPSRS